MTDEMAIKLSIVIPAYNAAKYISRCLDSLLDQDLDDSSYEIIVVNDGSKDNTLELVQSYADTNGTIKLIDKKNGGVGSARNLGVNSAIGKYIYFIDADDYFMKGVLNLLITTIESNNLDILTFNSEIISKANDFSPLKNSQDCEMSSIRNGQDYIAHNNYRNEVWWYLINREFFNQSNTNFIEGIWLEDAVFTLELFLKAKRMANFPLNAHRYLVVEGSAMTSKEPSHYKTIIVDFCYVALVFDSIINKLKRNPSSNTDCIIRLRARQQSFVFFMMVRMIKSTIDLKEVKSILDKLHSVGAYPLNAFLGKDNKGFSYTVLVKLFNSRAIYYLLFRIFNPFFRRVVHLKK